MERIGKEGERYQRTRLQVLLRWIEASQELEGANEETVPAIQEKTNLVENGTHKKTIEGVNQKDAGTKS